MVGITQPTNGEHVNADGVWDLLQNKGKMTVFSLCLLLCADLLDLAVGKSLFLHKTICESRIQKPLTYFIIREVIILETRVESRWLSPCTF